MLEPNPGHLPPEAAGRRIRGVLRCGQRFGFDNGTWAADGREACNWRLTGHDYDIVEWELAG